nr:hypothetical protein [Tanacetum cinerariifolium]
MGDKDDGFTTLSHHRKKGKNQANTYNKQGEGMKMNKPKVMVTWKKVIPTSQKPNKEKTDKDDVNLVKLQNYFDALRDHDDLMREVNVGETSWTNNAAPVDPDPNINSDDSKDPTCPLLVGRGFLATASVVIDCKKAKIAVREAVTRSISGVKEINLGSDVCKAIWDFFTNGRLLKEINHTFIALISKVPTPLRVNDFHLISCCNVIYKCISNILTNRIIRGIKEVVSENQSAFVLGKRISDNILITQELIYRYHRNRGLPRCAFKVDIQKAYDTVDWNFLGKILKCVRKVSLPDSFCYHKHCEELQLINVCFANDLFIFSCGDVDSDRLIMEELDEFKDTSGLVLSIPKSTVYFCNVVNHVKNSILSIMPFLEGKFLVKYLGVPLISSRILNRDCKVLIEQVKNKIGDWKNKSLSFAGRLQLCKSNIRGFLWCNGQYKQGKAKVAWSDIFLAKSEGGLGLRSLEIFNMALMTTRIWNIVSNKVSLCVRWIHTYKLRGRSFWDIPTKNDMPRNFRLYGSWSLVLVIVCLSFARIHVEELFRVWYPNSYHIEISHGRVHHLVANKLDTPRWQNRDGSLSDFSIRNVREAIRPRGDEVDWFCIVWLFVHLKLISFRFKNKDNVNRLLARWKMPRNFRLYGSWSLVLVIVCLSFARIHVEELFRVWYPSKEFQMVDVVVWKLSKADWDVP